MDKCSILVCSCDKYEELWGPFFCLLNKYWASCKYTRYILTETLTCSFKGVKTIRSKGAWSNRLLASLESINSEYVIFLLDDFFLMNYVDENEISRLLDIMDSNRDIAAFYFKHSTPQTSQLICYDRYIKMDANKKYAINFQAALWRVEALKELIPLNKSPWDIEENVPAFSSSKWCLYCPKDGSYLRCDNDVFPYLWALQSGYGVCKGRILWNNKKLFKKEEINYIPVKLRYMSYFEFWIKNIWRQVSNRWSKLFGKKI